MNAQTKTNSNFHREKYKVGVFLEKRHSDFFKFLAESKFRNNKTKTILYLIRKYSFYLYKISVMENKQTFTVEYQPKKKIYKKFGIWIDPLVWGKMNDLRKKLGFSMSFLLRIMIEWEMEEEGLLLDTPHILKPRLSLRILRKQEMLFRNTHQWESSSTRFKVNFRSRIVKANFISEFS